MVWGMENTFQLRADRRRVDRSKRKSFDPIMLNERQQEIINLHVMGLKETAIAEALNVTVMTVRNAIGSTLGQTKAAMIRGARDAETVDVAKKMQELIPKALEIYDKILDEEKNEGISISLQKATADVVLKEFSGLAVPKKVVALSAKLTPELIDEIKKNGKIAARECGLVVDEILEATNG